MLLGGDTQCCGWVESHFGASEDTLLRQDGILFGSHREPRYNGKIVCYFGATKIQICDRVVHFEAPEDTTFVSGVPLRTHLNIHFQGEKGADSQRSPHLYQLVSMCCRNSVSYIIP